MKPRQKNRLLAGVLLLIAANASAGLYEEGTQARARGDHRAAKDAFTRLLSSDSASGGALEGLTVTCLSLGEYEEALGHAERWTAAKPDSAYAQGFKERALTRLGREDEALEADRTFVRLDPCDARAQRRLDDRMRERRDGVFPRASFYKSIGTEDLNSARPQRLVYEGRSGETRLRKSLTTGLDLVGGLAVSQEAQRNDTGGFVYYDVLEQTYSAGLEGRPTTRLAWQAEYGQSLLSDVQGAGVGRTAFSRVKLGGQWRVAQTNLSARLTRSPYFLRGAGGSRFFALLREAGGRVEAETYRFGPGLLARAGVHDFSEGTTLKSWLTQATVERGHWLFTPGYTHGWTDFYGAAPDGRLRYVITDRLGLRVRRLVEDSTRLAASYGYVWHRDGNRLHDLATEATAWLPWLKDTCGRRPLYGSYRYELSDFAGGADGYLSTDRRAHILGGYWRHGWGGGTETMIGWERSFLKDSRGDYEGSAWVAEAEAYRRGDLALKAEGRVGTSTVRDEAYSGGLSARWSF